jgi:hypothetical protein
MPMAQRVYMGARNDRGAKGAIAARNGLGTAFFRKSMNRKRDALARVHGGFLPLVCPGAAAFATPDPRFTAERPVRRDRRSTY